MNKFSYFQNGLDHNNPNTPAPKEKKYKSDKAIVVQPRFKEPFYRNFDLYDTDEHLGPGSGYSHLNDYDSISDFLKEKRNRMKDRYKAEDSWIPEDNLQNRKTKIKARLKLLAKLTKMAIDFTTDDQIGSGSIMGDYSIYSDSVPIGGGNDTGLQYHDFEGKSPDQLNFEQDYSENDSEKARNSCQRCGSKVDAKDLACLNCGKVPTLYGLPDGFSNISDTDPLEDVNYPK